MSSWSARSCVESHRFICQHKKRRVSGKNRKNIYKIWNATFPNEYANEVMLPKIKKNRPKLINTNATHLIRHNPHNIEKSQIAAEFNVPSHKQLQHKKVEHSPNENEVVRSSTDRNKLTHLDRKLKRERLKERLQQQVREMKEQQRQQLAREERDREERDRKEREREERVRQERDRAEREREERDREDRDREEREREERDREDRDREEREREERDREERVREEREREKRDRENRDLQKLEREERDREERERKQRERKEHEEEQKKDNEESIIADENRILHETEAEEREKSQHQLQNLHNYENRIGQHQLKLPTREHRLDQNSAGDLRETTTHSYGENKSGESVLREQEKDLNQYIHQRTEAEKLAKLEQEEHLKHLQKENDEMIKKAKAEQEKFLQLESERKRIIDEENRILRETHAAKLAERTRLAEEEATRREQEKRAQEIKEFEKSELERFNADQKHREENFRKREEAIALHSENLRRIAAEEERLRNEQTQMNKQLELDMSDLSDLNAEPLMQTTTSTTKIPKKSQRQLEEDNLVKQIDQKKLRNFANRIADLPLDAREMFFKSRKQRKFLKNNKH